MKKKFILLILSIFASVFYLYFIAINEEQAILVTQNFLKERNISENSKLSKISIQEVVKNEDVVVFYIMTLGDKEGFVIV
jgi:hypothetical protein